MTDDIFSTSYVTLQPPFQIIKYGHDIGMQIGTLIVTKQTEGNEIHPFKIETHSYPVVAYENKEIMPLDQNLFSHNFMEGVVWNRVELKNVSTLCLSGAHLPWKEFINILWNDHYRAPIIQEIQKRIFNVLKKYGVTIELPTPDEFTLNLLIEQSNDKPEVVRSSENDIFALNVEWDDNVDVLAKRIISDLTSYLDIISPGRNAKGWHLTYETCNEKLLQLVKRLNSNREATSFCNIIVNSFHVTVSHHYKEEATDEDERATDPNNQQKEQHGDYYYGYDYDVFRENLDTNKIVTEIGKLVRYYNNNTQLIPIRQFVFILFNVFLRINWLNDTTRTHFVAWAKYNCKLYFESQDVEKIKLDEKMEEMVTNYISHFTILQKNGKIKDLSRFYKNDSMGFFLTLYNDGL